MTSLSLFVILAWPLAVLGPSGPETQAAPAASGVTQEPGAATEEAHVLAPEDRSYTFGMVDVPCCEILEEFARQSGLELIGTLPECRASFDCGQEEMSFDLALNRLSVQLLGLGEYWLVRKDNALEIVKPYWGGVRLDSPDWMFRNVDRFRESNLGDERIALVLYTKAGNLKDEEATLQKYLPAHVRARGLEDRDALTFFGVAMDLRRYLALAEMLGGNNAESSAVERFELKNVKPDGAVSGLQRILGGVAVYRSILTSGPSRDGGDSPQAEKPPDSPPIRVWIDEPCQSLIVRCSVSRMKSVRDALQSLDARTSAATAEEAHVLAPEKRSYTFRMVDVPCREILEEFARQSGLELTGTPPECRASFDCGQERMSFDLALNRLRILLLRLGEYWLVRSDDALQIRGTPYGLESRFPSSDRMFLDVDRFRESNLGDERVALVVYKTVGNVEDEEATIQNYLPAYVHVRALEDMDMLTFFGVVKDLRRYLALAEMLGGDDAQPSAVERFKLKNVEPDAAVRGLRRILGRVAVYKSILRKGPPGNGGDSPQAEEPPDSPPIRVWIDEPCKSLIVRCPPESMKDVRDALRRLDGRRPPASDGQ